MGASWGRLGALGGLLGAPWGVLGRGHTRLQRRPNRPPGQNGPQQATDLRAASGPHQITSKVAPPSGPHMRGHTRLQRRLPPPLGHTCGATPGYNEGRAALQVRHLGPHQVTAKAGNALQVTSASALVPRYIYIYIYMYMYKVMIYSSYIIH